MLSVFGFCDFRFEFGVFWNHRSKILAMNAPQHPVSFLYEHSAYRSWAAPVFSEAYTNLNGNWRVNVQIGPYTTSGLSYLKKDAKYRSALALIRLLKQIPLAVLDETIPSGDYSVS